MSRSPFSKEEKELLKKMKERPQKNAEEVATFLEKMMQEIATGRSLFSVDP